MKKLNEFVIEREVIAFKQQQGLSISEAVNLKSLLLKLNVQVSFRPLSGNFSGMCIRGNCTPRFMLINSNHSRGRQRFTIAHELYHLFIEENSKPHTCTPGITTKSVTEQSADLFASLFLMPKEGVFSLLPDDELAKKTISLASIVKLEQYFGVSRSAILHRLYSLKLISKAYKTSLSELPVSKTASSLGFDTSLYKPANEGLMIGDFGIKARTLFDKEIISQGSYEEYLHKIGGNGE